MVPECPEDQGLRRTPPHPQQYPGVLQGPESTTFPRGLKGRCKRTAKLRCFRALAEAISTARLSVLFWGKMGPHYAAQDVHELPEVQAHLEHLGDHPASALRAGIPRRCHTAQRRRSFTPKVLTLQEAPTLWPQCHGLHLASEQDSGDSPSLSRPWECCGHQDFLSTQNPFGARQPPQETERW